MHSTNKLNIALVASIVLIIPSFAIFPPMVLLFAGSATWIGIKLWHNRLPVQIESEDQTGKHAKSQIEDTDYITIPVTEYIGKHEISTDDLPHGTHTVETQDLF